MSPHYVSELCHLIAAVGIFMVLLHKMEECQVDATTIQELHASKLSTQEHLTSIPHSIQAMALTKAKQKLGTDLLGAPVQVSSREIEKQIVDRILGEGYDKRIRPAGSSVANSSKPG